MYLDSPLGSGADIGAWRYSKYGRKSAFCRPTSFAGSTVGKTDTAAQEDGKVYLSVHYDKSRPIWARMVLFNLPGTCFTVIS